MARIVGFPLFLVVLFTGCAGARFEPLAARSLPTAADYPTADAVILDDEREVRYDSDALSGKLVVDETVHVRLRILREGGARLARIKVGYDPAFSSITSFAARTVSAAGKERRFGWRDGLDAPQFGGWELYSDNRALALQLQPDTPGTVVEYRYTRRYRDWRTSTFEQRFDGPFPERSARLAVIAPSAWTVESEARRDGRPVELQPRVTQAGGLTTSVWEQHDLAALPDEPYSARGQRSLAVAVRLARWTERGAEVRAPADLRGLSAWLYDLTQPPRSTSAPAEEARALVRGLPEDPTLRAQRLYGWVRDHVSYCAIEIGLGGWQPHGAGETFRHGYGDCKDKANLLREMFAAVGGTSDLVVLFAHDGLPEPLDVITRRTNHAILRLHLPGGDVLADPTSPTTPFGRLPVNDQEADVLPLVAGGAALVRAPASRADDNVREVELDLTAKDGELGGAFSATVTGHPADELRALLMRVRHDGQAKVLAEMLGLASRRLASWTIDNLAPPEGPVPVTIKGALRLRHAWSPHTSLRLVSIANFVASHVPALPGGRRVGPLVFRCRQRLVDRVRIALDDATEVTLPAPTIIERPFGRYELRWERADGKLAITRTLVMNEHVFVAGAYGDVKGFFDEILAADERAIAIRRRNP